MGGRRIIKRLVLPGPTSPATNWGDVLGAQNSAGRNAISLAPCSFQDSRGALSARDGFSISGLSPESPGGTITTYLLGGRANICAATAQSSMTSEGFPAPLITAQRASSECGDSTPGCGRLESLIYPTGNGARIRYRVSFSVRIIADLPGGIEKV